MWSPGKYRQQAGSGVLLADVTFVVPSASKSSMAPISCFRSLNGLRRGRCRVFGWERNRIEIPSCFLKQDRSGILCEKSGAKKDLILSWHPDTELFLDFSLPLTKFRALPFAEDPGRTQAI